MKDESILEEISNLIKFEDEDKCELYGGKLSKFGGKSPDISHLKDINMELVEDEPKEIYVDRIKKDLDSSLEERYKKAEEFLEEYRRKQFNFNKLYREQTERLSQTPKTDFNDSLKEIKNKLNGAKFDERNESKKRIIKSLVNESVKNPDKLTDKNFRSKFIKEWKDLSELKTYKKENPFETLSDDFYLSVSKTPIIRDMVSVYSKKISSEENLF